MGKLLPFKDPQHFGFVRKFPMFLLFLKIECFDCYWDDSNIRTSDGGGGFGQGTRYFSNVQNSVNFSAV